MENLISAAGVVVTFVAVAGLSLWLGLLFITCVGCVDFLISCFREIFLDQPPVEERIRSWH